MSLIQYRQDIQILRGLAVLFVVLYHVKLPGFDNGLLGVDVFFVLSGYLMARLYDKRSPAEFLLARLNRLVPAYLVVTVATLVAAFFLVVPSDYRQVADQSLWAAGFLSNIYYWNQSSYFISSDFNPLLNYWSLAVEVQFYLIVPFLFPLLRRHKALAIGVFGISLLLCLAVLTKSEKTAFFMLPTRVWEFMLGAFAAWYGEKHYGRGGWTGAGLIAVLVALVFLFPLAPGKNNAILGHPSLAALLVTTLTMAVLTLGLPQTLEQSLPGKALTKLGDVSYSVYLVHFPVIVLINYVPFGGTVLGHDGLAGLALILGLTFAIAIPLHVYVERSRSLRLSGLSRMVPVLAVLAVVASAAAPLRMATLDASERNITAATQDNNQRRCPLSFRLLHPSKQLCLEGPGNLDKRIALIGDSHALSVRDQFVTQAAQHGFDTYFAAFDRPLLAPPFLPQDMDAELADPKLKAVVLHYRTARLERPGRQERITAFVERARAKGVPVYLLAPVPNYPDLVPRHMYLALETDKGMDGLQITTEQLREDNAAFEELREKLPPDVPVYDPADYLCTEGVCSYHDDDLRPYHYDEHHLTLTGAAVLAPLFDTLLTDVETAGDPALSH